MQNRRTVSVRHEESITRPVQGQTGQCESCMCNNGMLECSMLPNVNCSAGLGQATCGSNSNNRLMDGEAKAVNSIHYILTSVQ